MLNVKNSKEMTIVVTQVLLALLFSMVVISPTGAAMKPAPEKSPRLAEEALSFIQSNFQSCGSSRFKYENDQRLGEKTIKVSNETRRQTTVAYPLPKGTIEFSWNEVNYQDRPDMNLYRTESESKFRAWGMLSMLSPDTKVQDKFVVVECSSSDCWRKSGTTFKWTLHFDDKPTEVRNPNLTHPESQERHLSVGLCTADMAARVARALSDAIKASGGKPSRY